MKGDKGVIEYLNKVLRNELTAINQYFLHSRMLNSWGLLKLGEKAYKESIEEMQHADTCIERILFLDGLPAMNTLDKLMIGENSKETLENDLKLELKAIPELKEAIAYAEKVGDFESRNVFRTILADEEEHVDWIETQLNLIERIGLPNYEQTKM